MSEEPGTVWFVPDFNDDRTIESMAAEQRASNALTAGTHVAVPRELLDRLIIQVQAKVLDCEVASCEVCPRVLKDIHAARAILDKQPMPELPV